MSELLSIGQLAQRSGLTVSALRFYDREGVLTPAVVDAGTGYRRYDEGQVRTATVVASLRRIALPINDIRVAVETIDDHESVRDIVRQHLARLEAGVEDARREAERLDRVLVDSQEGNARVAGAQLARLIGAVLFAVGTDSEHEVLRGVLLEAEPGRLRAVATDRYRLAVHEVEADAESTWRCIVPASFAGALARLEGTATLHFDGTTISASVGAETLCETTLPGEFPDHRMLMPHGHQPASEPLDRIVLHDRDDDLVTIEGPDDSPGVTVRRTFLLEASEASDGQATLQLDGLISPLILRSGDGAVSLLMPVNSDS